MGYIAILKTICQQFSIVLKCKLFLYIFLLRWEYISKRNKINSFKDQFYKFLLKFVAAETNTGDLFSPERFQLIEGYNTHKNVYKYILYINEHNRCR